MGSDPGLVVPVSRIRSSRVRLHDCLVDVDLDRIVAPHGETALEPKAMAVLACLIRHAGEVVSTDELIDVVWRGRPMGDNPVYRCVAQLRRALGDDPRLPRYIATVPTKGYRLVAPVVTLAPDLPSSPTLHMEPVASHAATARSHRGALVGALLLALLLVIPAALFWQRTPVAASGAAPADPLTLAVLPLHTVGRDEPSALLAQSVTGLIHDRLARLPGLVVVAGGMTAPAAGVEPDPSELGRRLHARYLLRGDVAQNGDRLHVAVQLLDGRSGAVVWSSVLDRLTRDVASIRDEVARNVAGKLSIPVAALPGRTTTEAAINLDAYAVYLRGRQVLRNADAPDVDQARELFRRATILDPEFARGYLGLGLAYLQQAGAAPNQALTARNEATKAFDRALQLDPGLGEAWIARARIEFSQDKAEAYFRKGLAVTPGDAEGYAEYATFLFRNSRVGEAIDVVDRARRLLPQATELSLLQAFMIMVTRSDVAGHDRLVREALKINPQLPAALEQLAYSNWEYSGQFAQAARIIERDLVVDPRSDSARALARDIYLDLGDPAAAAAALGPSPVPEATMELAQFRGDRVGAAAVLGNIAPAAWPDLGPQAAKAQAVRDAAIATGDFAPAVRLLGSVQAATSGELPMARRGFVLVYAHTLVLAGKIEEGRKLAAATLALVDAHGAGRSPHWFCRERASALAILGNDGQVLEELAHCIDNGQIYRWWYLAGHDPLYQHFRGDPGFQLLERRAQARLERQRALAAAVHQAAGAKATSK